MVPAYLTFPASAASITCILQLCCSTSISYIYHLNHFRELEGENRGGGGGNDAQIGGGGGGAARSPNWACFSNLTVLQ